MNLFCDRKKKLNWLLKFELEILQRDPFWISKFIILEKKALQSYLESLLVSCSIFYANFEITFFEKWFCDFCFNIGEIIQKQTRLI